MADLVLVQVPQCQECLNPSMFTALVPGRGWLYLCVTCIKGCEICYTRVLTHLDIVPYGDKADG